MREKQDPSPSWTMPGWWNLRKERWLDPSSWDPFFCTNGITSTCIFRMWFAWQTPWKTSGMQTGGTRCLSATFACVLLINGYVCGFFSPDFQTYSVNMKLETGTVRPGCARWFEGRWSGFLLTRLPSHPKCTCVASSFIHASNKKLSTWQTCLKHFQRGFHWWRLQQQCPALRSPAQSLLPQAVSWRAGIVQCRSSPLPQPT